MYSYKSLFQFKADNTLFSDIQANIKQNYCDGKPLHLHDSVKSMEYQRDASYIFVTTRVVVVSVFVQGLTLSVLACDVPFWKGGFVVLSLSRLSKRKSLLFTEIDKVLLGMFRDVSRFVPGDR